MTTKQKTELRIEAIRLVLSRADALSVRSAVDVVRESKVIASYLESGK